MKIRDLQPYDLDAVLALNQTETPNVGSVGPDRLRQLFDSSEVALVAEIDGTLAGFMVALGPHTDYDSVNYQFFVRRGSDFTYIDRVAVAPQFRRRGVASRLYAAVEAAARTRGRHELTCEVNLRPVNAPSLAFHLAREFGEVGRQDTSGGSVRVLMLAKRLRSPAAEFAASAGVFELDDVTSSNEPLSLVGAWIDVAHNAGVRDASAMILATVQTDGEARGVDARAVLARGVDARGVRFFTNRTSAKGRQLRENPHAAGVFCWPDLQRQIRVRGTVTPVGDADADSYFASRPRDAQIGAWASQQSQRIADRQSLDDAVAEITARFADAEQIRRPPQWGGYVLQPTEVEFWQGRNHRLHDRMLYAVVDGGWHRQRLQP
ncbi:MAG: pyridoxamine 5'-phosphate oxidase [Nitriliruptoraceae bacterium]